MFPHESTLSKLSCKVLLLEKKVKDFVAYVLNNLKESDGNEG